MANLSTLSGSRKRNIYAAENTIRRGAAKAKKGVGMAVNAVKANPGKAGMALAGLAAAGGLGMAGLKAVGARKKKANSPLGKVLNGNPTLKKGAIGLSKRLNKMGIKN